MQAYIRPLRAGIVNLRALMPSALPLLTKAVASQAGASCRACGSWADLSCQQRAYPAPRAGGCLYGCVFSSSLVESSLLLGKNMDTPACWLRIFPLVPSRVGVSLSPTATS